MQIDINGMTLNYELEGEGDCLVLIHGFSDHLGMWYGQRPEFSRYYRVLAYDFRGHGRTITPGGGMSMVGHADDLLAMLEALDIDRAALVGYSMGGRIGLEFALKYPEKVTGLVMANMGVAGREFKMSGEQAELTRKHLRMMIRLCESGDLGALAEELTVKSLSREFQAARPEVGQRYKELKLQGDPRHYPAVIQAIIETLDSPPDLTQVGCPVLLVAGEKDPFKNPEIINDMQSRMKADLKVLPTGHASAIEAPELFNKIVLDFLARVLP